MKKRFAAASLLLLLAALFVKAERKEKEGLRVVPSVDLPRYAGLWYEVARLPNRFEEKCAGDVTAEYTLVAPAFAGLSPRQAPRASAEDLKRLTGARWTGTLTYLDYRSNKRVSIPSNLTVKQAEGDENAWVFEYEYPEEPKANGRQTLKIENGGTVFDGETVSERTSLGGSGFRLVTTKRGRDNDREALFRFTYTLDGPIFSIKKEVRPEGASEFFERNEYSWKR